MRQWKQNQANEQEATKSSKFKRQEGSALGSKQKKEAK
jgi:hypothetical protein